MLGNDDLPKFGPAGAEPPLTSAPVIISQAFFGVRLDEPSVQAAGAIRILSAPGAEVRSRFPEPVEWMNITNWANWVQLYRAGTGALGAGWLELAFITGSNSRGLRLAMDGLIGGRTRGAWPFMRLASKLCNVEFRRVVYSQRWVRNDKIIQMSPGETLKRSTSRTVGISSTKSKELSRSLGFSRTGRAGVLQAQISERIETTVTIHEEHQDTQECGLTNDRTGYYRRVACWYVQHEFAVDALIASSVTVDMLADPEWRPSDEAQDLQWVPRESASFVSPYAGNSTCADIPA